jgi:hypothetical protein
LPASGTAAPFYLKASNTEANDDFGSVLSLSGDTLVVGASYEDSSATGVDGDQADNSAADSGAVYVFVRNGGVWSQQAYLKASNTDAGDGFGYAVAISGDTLVVGAPNEASNAIGVNGDQTNNDSRFAGAAYVFTRSEGIWSQQAYLKASNTEPSDWLMYWDLFGWAVSIHGDTIVVGAVGESSKAQGVNGDQTNNATPQAGAAYVFTRSGTTWSQQAYLKASNTEKLDQFGDAVTLFEDTLVIGAGYEDSNATGINGDQANNLASASGAVYVFTRSGTTWSQQAYLKASNTEKLDTFGTALSLYGDTLVVGAGYEDSHANGVNGNQADNSAPDAGAVYVFTRSGTTWSQQAYLKASNSGAADLFGYAVSLSEDTLIVGAFVEASQATGVDGDQTDDSAFAAGAAYVFVRNGDLWNQQAYLKAPNTEADDEFGHAVSVSHGTFAIGANFESSNSTGVNGDGTNNLASKSGAAYVYNAPIFADVPIAHWANSYIERLYTNGISSGCSTDPLRYCPNANVTRGQMAVLLLKGMYGAAYTPPDATGTIFNDIPADHMFAKWIEQLAAEGITGGCGNSNYCPDAPVTREQLAVFLLRAEHGNTYNPPAAAGVFNDVPAGYWAASWIEQLAAEGITGGCGGGKFCPKTIVNRAQMAVFLVTAFNLP